VKQEFTSRGHSFGTAAAAKRAMTVERPMPAAAPPLPPPAEEEFNLQIEPEEELALEVEPEAAEETVMTFDTGAEAELSLEEEAPALEEQPFFGVEAISSPEPQIEFEPEPMAELEIEPEKLQTEDLDELDDLIAEGKLKDARGKLDELDARFPGEKDLAKRKKRLDVAVAAAEAVAAAAKPKPAPPPPKAAPPPPPPPRPAAKPPVLSRTEIESELLSAIPDDDEFP